ncbi:MULTISPECIES: porin [unclassified Hyphomicrobium]|uniref:porin n=1 Tax=unclassified Hyphomicrobium TaxID=2619925 RepID=UPI000213E6E4|nr:MULTISPECIES: porin [unclassified Hyphomicrobium]CCB67164.1 Phosphate-selective porin O and P [Hyphomicrobium sp. MC1]
MRNTRRMALLAIGLGLASNSGAHAGERFELWDDQSWISFGASVKAQYIYNPDVSNTDDFALTSARINVNGQFNKVWGFTYNTEIDHAPDDTSDISRVRTLDAILRAEFNPSFNVWAGRMLPPTDRVNLDGPYYQADGGEYPFISVFPQLFGGRDNGGSVWGDIGKFKYMIGGFQGCTAGDNSCANPDAHGPLVSGRVQYDFWDKEAGYYTSSDYYGEKELLSVGLVGQFQSNAATDGIRSGDYKGFSADVLMQKKVFGGDVFTLEGAYYVYDTSGIDTSLVTGNGVPDGNSYMFLTSYLINQKVGPGKFQPVFRYQEFDHNFSPDISEYSVGTNYIIKGHDMMMSALYSKANQDTAGNKDVNRFIGTIQVNF